MRVFLSHGIDMEKDAAGAAFLGTLFDRLKAATHEPLLDRRTVRPGDAWESVLHDALAECQAAVLVLTRRALERPWVQKEATILSFRKKREPGFAFFCVLLEDLAVADLAPLPAFAALGLDDNQAFKPGTDADAVADWTVARLSQVVPLDETPMDRLVAALQSQLAKADAPQLEALCESLLGEPVEWVASQERAQQHARALATAILRGRLRSLDVADLVKRLKRVALGDDSRKAVRELVASVWVDPEVAGRFATLGYATGEQPFVGAFVSSHWRYSSRMLAWRSQLPDISEFVLWLTGGNSDAREEEIVAEIRRLYRRADPDVDDDDEVDALLRARRQPLVVVLPRPVPDEALLLALRKLYPNVLFLAHAGRDDPPPGSLPEGVLLLPLGLTPDEEARRFADFSAAREV